MSENDHRVSIDEAFDPRILAFAARHFAGAIRDATSADLAAMARIHARSGTPGLLTDLGESFLRDTYYAGLLASPLGRASVIEVDGNVAGFVTYSSDSGRLFGEIFRPRLGSALIALARASARRPRVLIDFFETVRSVDRPETGSAIPAETVSLEVDPAFQGLGLGFLLFQTAVTKLQAAGSNRIKSRILSCNRAVERLHPPLGFVKASDFHLHRRSWSLWVLDGTLSSPPKRGT